MRLARAGRVEDRVRCGPGRLVGALHGGEVDVAAHVVAGEEQVRDRRGGLGTLGQRARRVYEQRLSAHDRATGEHQGRVEEPVDEHAIAQLRVARAVESGLDLGPALGGDLVGGAVDRRLAVEDPRREEVGDVDRQDVRDPSVAVASTEVAVPEQALVDRGEGPRAGQVGDVSVHRLRSEEHTSELQSLMRISYAVVCSNNKTNYINTPYNRHYPGCKIYHPLPS